MLKISYQYDRENFWTKQLVEIAGKTNVQAYYSKEYTEFLENLNKCLQEAFNAGRHFERSYKPEEEE